MMLKSCSEKFMDLLVTLPTYIELRGGGGSFIRSVRLGYIGYWEGSQCSIGTMRESTDLFKTIIGDLNFV